MVSRSLLIHKLRTICPFSSSFQCVTRTLCSYIVRKCSYVTGRSQYIRTHNKVSSAIPNNCDVLQDAVLSPLIFTLHTFGLFSESLASFLKYVDDVVIGHLCRDPQGLSIIKNALKYASEWPGKNGCGDYSLWHSRGFVANRHIGQPCPASHAQLCDCSPTPGDRFSIAPFSRSRVQPCDCPPLPNTQVAISQYVYAPLVTVCLPTLTTPRLSCIPRSRVLY